MLIHTTLEGYQDASRYMCRGVILPGPTEVPWDLQLQTSTYHIMIKLTGVNPIVWQVHLPPKIMEDLISWTNTNKVTNSDLEL